MIVRGGWPRRPEATSSTISATSRKPFWNAAQCSRSAVTLSFSPTLLPTRPQAPWAIASLNASIWCSAGDIRNGSEVPISRWSTSPLHLVVEPGPLAIVEHGTPVGPQHPGRS